MRPQIAGQNTTNQMIRMITEAFNEITPEEIRRCIAHVEEEVWPKVARLEDL